MTPPQDSVSDVERLRAAIREALTRHSNELYWACEYGRDFPADVIADIAESARAALAVPINKIGEDAVEDLLGDHLRSWRRQHAPRRLSD